MIELADGRMRTRSGGWTQRWPWWAGYAASGCAALFGLVLLLRAIAGRHHLVGLPQSAWPGSALLFAAAVLAAATVRPWGRRLPTRVVTAGTWTAAAVFIATSCFVLLQLIELVVTGTVSDRQGNSDWPTFAQRLCFLAVGALFVASAVSWHRRSTGRCTRCGRVHPAEADVLARPAPQAAPRGLRWTAYAGCAAFGPYLTVHGVHAVGLAPGLDHWYSNGSVPFPVFAAFALGLVAPAVILLLGLVRPWGMVFPRWTLWLAGKPVPRFLMLIPVWLIAPTLALYGFGSTIFAIVNGYNLVGLGGAASLAFGGYGSALAAAAVSYQIRTRPRCVGPVHVLGIGVADVPESPTQVRGQAEARPA